MKLYYEIWADALEAIKNSKSYMTYKDKVVTVFVGFTIAQGFNLVFILFLLSSVLSFNLFINFNLFPGNYLDKALSGIVTLYLPFAVFNYYLIFFKKKHLKYFQNRKINTGGKALLLYFVSSILLVLVYIIIGKSLV
jgi:hypothetical protein